MDDPLTQQARIDRLERELSELANYAWHLHEVAKERGVRLPSWDDWCRNKEQSR